MRNLQGLSAYFKYEALDEHSHMCKVQQFMTKRNSMPDFKHQQNLSAFLMTNGMTITTENALNKLSKEEVN